MRITRLLPLTLPPLVLLGACDRQDSLMRAESPPALSTPAPARGPPTFVGVWASTAAACARQPWRLSPTHIAESGGVDCSIDQLDVTLAGYTAHSICTRAGVSAPGRIVLTMSSAGGHSLTLSDGPFREPVSLVRCPGGGGNLTPAG